MNVSHTERIEVVRAAATPLPAAARSPDVPAVRR